MNSTNILIFVTIFLAITVLFEIYTILSLIRKLNEVKELMSKSFKEIFEKLSPLINALNKATPLIEVVNAISNLFGKPKQKKK